MKDRLPESARRGVSIEDPQPYSELRKYAENAADWPFRDEAAYLYRHATGFKERFLDPVLLTDRRRLPDPVIAFEPLKVKTLASYTLSRNPQGLLYEITFNTKHYVEQNIDGKPVLTWRFGRWAQLETLLHEQVHLWQQNFGENPVTPGRVYHNKEFVEKCEEFGLHPKLNEGYHLRIADGLFSEYMKELGIEPPSDTEKVVKAEDIDWFKKGKERKGRSTLRKYQCPGCGANVRWGKQEDPQLLHIPCGEIFLDATHGNVYEAPQEGK